jgi:SAM-dependent methyltransferase
MAQRCLELLNLDASAGPQLILDVGCGSGLSGDVLAESGHNWVGLDVSQHMLNVARARGSLGPVSQKKVKTRHLMEDEEEEEEEKAGAGQAAKQGKPAAEEDADDWLAGQVSQKAKPVKKAGAKRKE